MQVKTTSAALSNKYCFVIPCYNHGQTIMQVLQNIEAYQMHCFIVDDGSDLNTIASLELAASEFDWVTLIHLPTNQGKGAAVMEGIRQAYLQHYSNAIQIDADGQHNCQDITALINESEQYPHFLISGQPIYDDSVPKHRLFARYITHFWVWIETLSLSIKDSMCGFRIYPLQAAINVIDKYQIGRRMDFDPEIMVRLYWEGTPTRFIPTQVIYPENGISHFKALKDNLLISWMHTKLFFGMLPRSISLITRKCSNTSNASHWSQTQERKGLWGIKLILKLYRLFGHNAAKIIMLPVITYFWLTGTSQRQASSRYLQKIKKHYKKVPLISQKRLTSFRHFLRFGDSLLDKLASWMGKITIDDLYYPDVALGAELIKNKQGIIILGSHLGDMEMCRAIANESHDVTINALVFTRHAARFNQILKETNAKSSINLIQVDEISADTIILLKQKLDVGEWVAIVGDRTSANPYQRIPEESVVWADFLGQPAPFPKGPFVLASVLSAPIYLVWGLKPNGRFQFYLEHFSDQLQLPRKERQQALKNAVQRYAHRLEYYCLLSPLDWFNFYDFWHSVKPQTEQRHSGNINDEK